MQFNGDKGGKFGKCKYLAVDLKQSGDLSMTVGDEGDISK